MAGLGDTILDLAQLRHMQESLMAGLGDSGRLTLTAPSGSNPGNLRMLTYVPPGLKPGAPLVVVLHGCTQHAGGYDHGTGWSRLAERQGFALLFPEQEPANNPNLCFNWFQPDDVTRDRGEVLSIRQMVAQMVASHRLDPARIYVTGLSAGGAITAALLATYPEVFAGGAIIAGLPYGAAQNYPEALDAMYRVRHRRAEEWGDLVRAATPYTGPWPSVQIWHGDADATVRHGNAEELLKQWANVHGVRQPDIADRVDGALHAAWRGQDGRIVLESYLVPGLAHGTPLSTAAVDLEQRLGFVAPHSLEAGISSTWRIAWSWGLLKPAAQTAARPPAPRPDPEPRSVTSSLGDIFESALRAVGLH